ncbi:hypothetical protein LEMLEM_LOCUS13110 [Lemmus lemmus]
MRGALTGGSGHRRDHGRDRRAALQSFTGSDAETRSFRDADWPHRLRVAVSSGFGGPAPKSEGRGAETRAGGVRTVLGAVATRGAGTWSLGSRASGLGRSGWMFLGSSSGLQGRNAPFPRANFQSLRRKQELDHDKICGPVRELRNILRDPLQTLARLAGRLKRRPSRP